jgi:hypothetical protein
MWCRCKMGAGGDGAGDDKLDAGVTWSCMASVGESSTCAGEVPQHARGATHGA